MQRRGASHIIKRARIENKPTKTYSAARQKLHENLKQFSFVKVVEIVNVPASAGKPEFYHGIAITFGKQMEVFFDKGSRLRYNSLIEIGPAKLIDAAVSRDHVNSTPHVGDILVGVVADNLRKSRIPKVLRSWSRHGNLVQELGRLFEHGTHQSDANIRKLLTQTEAIMAENLGARPTLKPATDDLWILAKVILWGDTRILAVMHSLESDRKLKKTAEEHELSLATTIKISSSASDFVSGIAFRFEDPEVLKDFHDYFEPVTVSPESLTFHSMIPPVQQILAGGTSPPYEPYDPETALTFEPKSPAYGATSPLYGTSPSYNPTSPIEAERPSAE